MVGQHLLLNGHKIKQTPGDSEGQGNLAFFSPWGCKQSDTTEKLTTATIIKGNMKNEDFC